MWLIIMIDKVEPKHKPAIRVRTKFPWIISAHVIICVLRSDHHGILRFFLTLSPILRSLRIFFSEFLLKFFFGSGTIINLL